MFRNWGFLLGEIWVLLALAALIGLFAGWLIWGRREAQIVVDSAASDEAARLKAALADCEKGRKTEAGRIAALEADIASGARLLADARSDLASSQAKLADCTAKVAAKAAVKADPAPAPAPSPAPAAAPAAALMAAPAEPVVAAKPASLAGPRGGKADDLKLIKGVGPVLEKLCHSLGYFHFDQIANWTASEIAWVDDNLEGFKGRVTRDEWVAQAKDLAAGKPPRPGGEH